MRTARSLIIGCFSALMLLSAACSPQTTSGDQPQMVTSASASVAPHAATIVPLVMEPSSSDKIVIGWMMVHETADLNARIGNTQPADYIVWLWQNRASLKLAEGIEGCLVIRESEQGNELWRTCATQSILRVEIPRALAERAVRVCLQVKRKLVHAASVVAFPGGEYRSCSKLLPARSKEGKRSFGIPGIIETIPGHIEEKRLS